MRPSLLFIVLAGLVAIPALAGESDGSDANPAAAQSAQTQANDSVDTDQLYQVGRALFDRYAPDEIKQQYEFPTLDEWNTFLPKLQKALDGNSLQDLAALEPEAKRALRYLESVPEASDLADWLRERIELMDAARALGMPAAPAPEVLPGPPPERIPGQVVPAPQPSFPAPAQPPPARRWNIPAYDYFYSRLLHRPKPADAGVLMPLLTQAFTLEHVPGALSWLAEVESSLNPSARSPAGAKGLFQLMPDTAKSLGLSTWMPDERTQPTKSAQAAARLLRSLHTRFGDWPLAIAAYNAGEGRIRRILASHPGARSFADIASVLPVETRLYVPKVLATIAVRTGVTPDRLDALSD